MKLSITGAPGSGKTKLAKALAKALPNKVTVVDGYVNKLSKRTGYEYGNFASYPQNFQILCERYTKEQEAEHLVEIGLTDDIIVVGSIFETILYTAIRVNSDLYFNEENASTIQMYGRAAMQMLGAFEALTIDHDLFFFLPFSGKQLLEKGKSYDTAIDQKLPEVADGYFRQLIPLTGTQKEKITNAKRYIDALADQDEREGQTEEPTVPV